MLRDIREFNGYIRSVSKFAFHGWKLQLWFLLYDEEQRVNLRLWSFSFT